MWILHFYKVLTLWLFRHIFHSLSWVTQSMNCLTLKSNRSLLLKCACPAAAWSCGASAAPDRPISQEWMPVKICLSKKMYISFHREKELQKASSSNVSFSKTSLGSKYGENSKTKNSKRSKVHHLWNNLCHCHLSSVTELHENTQEETWTVNCENNFKNFDIGSSWEVGVLHARNYTWVLKILGGRMPCTLEFALFWFILFQNLTRNSNIIKHSDF